MAAGGQGQGDGGIGGAAGGDGGVPEGGRVGGAGGYKGQLTHGMKAHVHARVLSRMTRGGSRGEKKGSDLTSAPVDIDAGWYEVCLARKTKALFAQHDAGLKDSLRRLLNITHRDKTAYAQHDQRIGVCSRPHLTRLFTHSTAGDCRGRRECRLVASAAVIVLFHKHSLLRLLPDTLPGRGGDARGVLQGGEIA